MKGKASYIMENREWQAILGRIEIGPAIRWNFQQADSPPLLLCNYGYCTLTTQYDYYGSSATAIYLTCVIGQLANE